MKRHARIPARLPAGLLAFRRRRSAAVSKPTAAWFNEVQAELAAKVEERLRRESDLNPAGPQWAIREARAIERRFEAFLAANRQQSAKLAEPQSPAPSAE